MKKFLLVLPALALGIIYGLGDFNNSNESDLFKENIEALGITESQKGEPIWQTYKTICPTCRIESLPSCNMVQDSGDHCTPGRCTNGCNKFGVYF